MLGTAAVPPRRGRHHLPVWRCPTWHHWNRGEGYVTHVMRIAMVAAPIPSRTSRIRSSRVCICSPALSSGTCSGSTADRNLSSLGLPWTRLAIWWPWSTSATDRKGIHGEGEMVTHTPSVAHKVGSRDVLPDWHLAPKVLERFGSELWLLIVEHGGGHWISCGRSGGLGSLQSGKGCDGSRHAGPAERGVSGATEGASEEGYHGADDQIRGRSRAKLERGAKTQRILIP